MPRETACIATPGFSGFIPSMRYQIGLSYGAASKVLAHPEDGHLHGHHIPQHQHQHQQQQKEQEEQLLALEKKKVDDRFSFPPVPGYTGYIPRSHEYFAESYVPATKHSLADFNALLKRHKDGPRSVHRIKQLRGSTNELPAVAGEPKYTGGFHEKDWPERMSPFKAPHGHPDQTFMAGYTGFIPRHQNFFGKTYDQSVRQAIEEFATKPQDQIPGAAQEQQQQHPSPIPGFTGFIPGAKHTISTTYGKSTSQAYGAFDRRDRRTGKVPDVGSEPKKLDRGLNRPIVGYKGHIPGQF